jgi:signal transduction histidine kinase
MPTLAARLRRLLLDLPMRRKLLAAILATVSLPLLGLAAFSVGYFLQASQKAASASLHDKLGIGLLVLENAAAELQAVNKRVAGDKALTINLDLGLYQSASQYLGDIASGQGLDFACVVGSAGQLLAGAGLLAGGLPLVLPAGDAALEAAAGTGGRWFWSMPGVTLASLVPLRNAQGSLLGYSVIGWQVGRAGQSGKAGGALLPRRIADHTEADLLLGNATGLAYASTALAGLVLDAAGLLAELSPADSQAELGFYLRGNWRGLATALRGPDGQPVGFLGVAVPNSTLEAGRWLTLGVIVFIFILAFLLSAAVASWFAGTIARPVAAIALATQEIIKGNFELDLKPEGHDEIGLMTEDFAVMSVQLRRLVSDLEHEVADHKAAESEIRLLNAELETRVGERTAELNHSLELLRTTQAELVESDKMAALSHLVVGIAHELNTPIGNSLTSSSFLEQQLLQLEKEAEGGTLSRTQFGNYLKILREAAVLNQASLQKASRLVGFFKEMAVNLEADPPAPVNLRNLVEDAIRRIGTQGPAGMPRLENRLPPDLVLSTCVVPLTRAMTAILENSAAHAFHGRNPGTVTVMAERADGWVELRICDDGIGISEGDRKKVFEPFYTTARGGGHVGLGLSIAFNSVVHRLGGTIQCQARDGGGVCFVVRLPQPPDTAAAGGVR